MDFFVGLYLFIGLMAFGFFVGALVTDSQAPKLDLGGFVFLGFVTILFWPFLFGMAFSSTFRG